LYVVSHDLLQGTKAMDVIVLHATALNVERISCQQLLSRGPELARHLGYSSEGIEKDSWAARGMSVEARSHGGGVPSMQYGGVTASLQSIGATGMIKPEAKRAIAAVLRQAGILTDRDYLAALEDRRQLIVVQVPKYFTTPRPEIPLLIDYKQAGYNIRMAQEMLVESRFWNSRDSCPCDCSLKASETFRVVNMSRNENTVVFERFKMYEAIVGDELNRGQQGACVAGIHPWLERLASRNGLSRGSNTVYLLHGTTRKKLAAICNEGLRTRFSLQANKRPVYGKGLYFTTSSCKALQYSKENGYILVCRVVLGRIQVLESEGRSRLFADPPYHSAMAQAGHTVRRGGVQVHDEYIVFSEDAVYPEFVLEVTKA